MTAREAMTTQITNDIRLANYDFSVQLLKQLSHVGSAIPNPPNVFLSPASISLVLAMCYLGADGQTKSQMKSKLYGSDREDDEIKAWSQKILKFASEKSEKYQLRFTNRIYLNDKVRLKDDYVESIQNVFNASVLNRNFETNAARITQEINDWVEQNRKVHVDMMRLKENKGYYEDQEVQVLALGYAESKIDENGTEAAAATYIKMVPLRASLPAPSPKKFIADHPFLLVLTVGSRNEKELLFIGKFYGTSD
uniref:Serpin domain-containing protein n=1 Tax=Romanomermis culicivorax TaxID=13658 RepID=A0A915KMC8_ROMCU